MSTYELLHFVLQSSDAEPTQEESMKSKLAKSGAGKVNCRICKGDHFTAKCPYKDTLGALDNPGESLSFCSQHSFLNARKQTAVQDPMMV